VDGDDKETSRDGQGLTGLRKLLSKGLAPYSVSANPAKIEKSVGSSNVIGYSDATFELWEEQCHVGTRTI